MGGGSKRNPRMGTYERWKIIKAWYASTSGGYQSHMTLYRIGTMVATTQHQLFGIHQMAEAGWTSQAYEKIAGSPWFYKGWYRDRSGNSCGKSHPWLTSEEMADILNAWVVLYQGGGGRFARDTARIVLGGNPYNMGDLRSIGGY